MDELNSFEQVMKEHIESLVNGGAGCEAQVSFQAARLQEALHSLSSCITKKEALIEQKNRQD